MATDISNTKCAQPLWSFALTTLVLCVVFWHCPKQCDGRTWLHAQISLIGEGHNCETVYTGEVLQDSMASGAQMPCCKLLSSLINVRWTYDDVRPFHWFAWSYNLVDGKSWQGKRSVRSCTFHARNVSAGNDSGQVTHRRASPATSSSPGHQV